MPVTPEEALETLRRRAVRAREAEETHAAEVLARVRRTVRDRLPPGVGAWLVVLSRWLPIFPEVIACLAGLARMPPLSFFAALACGSAPLGFVFAAIGHAGVSHPVLAIALSAGLPPLLWLAVQPYFVAKRRTRID